MAETTTNQETLHIQKPLPGQSSVLAVDPGTTVYLDFPLDQAEAVFQDGDLIFRFENGGQVELDNFEEVLSSTNLLLADGTEVSGDQIMDTLQPEAGEPAAGAALPSGGAGEYNDYLGDSPDGIDRLGTLGPREFGFTSEEPRAAGVDEEPPETPEPTPEPPPEPPQAFDDFQNFVVDNVRNERNEVTQRFYDIDGHGDILDNDIPEGVSVIGFSVDGSEFGPRSLGIPVTLNSGAQFTLSADGTYQYVYDNTETFSDVDQVIDSSAPPIAFDPIDPAYDTVRISFDMDSLDLFDKVQIDYTDSLGNPMSTAAYGGFLMNNNGELELFDEDGIDSLQIGVTSVLSGSSATVTFDALNLIDTDANLSQEIINYTIADDANGLTDSADLIISFSDSPPSEPIPMPESDFNNTVGPM